MFLLADKLPDTLQVMRDFQSKSGLAINIRKTCVFVDGDESAFTTLASDFGVVCGSLPVR